MNIIEAIILGLVQGFTEFLPVSSSGHLLIVGRFLGVGEVSVGFELVCHLGTLAAVLLVMRKDVFSIVKKPFSRPTALLAVATLITGAIGAVISLFFRDALEGEYLIFGFIATGILLLCCEFGGTHEAEKKMNFGHAAIIGAAQGIAALPGLSRSGTTIAAAKMLGFSREQSARFSFLLSVPVIIGSSLVELLMHGVGAGIGVWALIAACAASFISGLVAVKFMLKLLGKHGMDGFAVYLFVLSVFLLINEYALGLF